MARIGLHAWVAFKAAFDNELRRTNTLYFAFSRTVCCLVCIKQIILGLDMAKVMNVLIVQLVHLLIGSFSGSFVPWFIHKEDPH